MPNTQNRALGVIDGLSRGIAAGFQGLAQRERNLNQQLDQRYARNLQSQINTGASFNQFVQQQKALGKTDAEIELMPEFSAYLDATLGDEGVLSEFNQYVPGAYRKVRGIVNDTRNNQFVPYIQQIDRATGQPLSAGPMTEGGSTADDALVQGFKPGTMLAGLQQAYSALDPRLAKAQTELYQNQRKQDLTSGLLDAYYGGGMTDPTNPEFRDAARAAQQGGVLDLGSTLKLTTPAAPKPKTYSYKEVTRRGPDGQYYTVPGRVDNLGNFEPTGQPFLSRQQGAGGGSGGDNKSPWARTLGDIGKMSELFSYGVSDETLANELAVGVNQAAKIAASSGVYSEEELSHLADQGPIAARAAERASDTGFLGLSGVPSAVRGPMMLTAMEQPDPEAFFRKFGNAITYATRGTRNFKSSAEAQAFIRVVPRAAEKRIIPPDVVKNERALTRVLKQAADVYYGDALAEQMAHAKLNPEGAPPDVFSVMMRAIEMAVINREFEDTRDRAELDPPKEALHSYAPGLGELLPRGGR